MEENKQVKEKQEKVNTQDTPVEANPVEKENTKSDDSKRAKKHQPRKRGFGRNRRGAEQKRSEFETRLLSARRVTRVVAGGRRFSLSVAVAVGNRNGKVGIGTGKGPDMAIAIEKAQNQARKNVVTVPITDEKSIPSEVTGKFCASLVQLRPSRGFVAGGAVRTIAEIAGIQNLNAKILSRSKSHLNNARATLKALETIK